MLSVTLSRWCWWGLERGTGVSIYFVWVEITVKWFKGSKAESLNPGRSLFTTIPSRSSSLITTSYFPSILITVAGNDNNRPVRKQSYPAGLYFVFTFLGTLQPLALGSVEGGHFVGLAGRPADAGAVHGSDPEVVGAAHAQAVHRVFTDLHWGIVALDPGVAASFTPTPRTGRWQHQYNLIHVPTFTKYTEACFSTCHCVKKRSDQSSLFFLKRVEHM